MDISVQMQLLEKFLISSELNLTNFSSWEAGSIVKNIVAIFYFIKEFLVLYPIVKIKKGGGVSRKLDPNTLLFNTMEGAEIMAPKYGTQYSMEVLLFENSLYSLSLIFTKSIY